VTPRSTRLLRRGLLGLFLAVVLSVAWTLRRPARARTQAGTSPTPTPSLAGSAPQNTRQENMVYKQFKGERESFLLKARTWLGQEQEMRFQGVEVTLSYVARGKPGQAVISSDECTYEPTPQRALFKGNVVVRTEDGFELKTQSLLYRGDKGIARTEDPAEFQRKDLSGSSTGFIYQAEERRLELLADAVIHIRDPDKPETEIRSRRAIAERDQGLLRFEENVEVTQGKDHLKADRLNVNIGEDDVVYRIQAVDGVELKTAGDLPGATVASGGRGPRILLCKKLDVFFRPDKTISEAVAGPDADLTILPGPGEQPERRRLKGRILTFRFDEKGRLQEVQGQKDSFFSAEALPPATAVPRTLTCQSFVARLDPETGQADTIEFTRDLEFIEGTQKATAQKGWYEGATGKLILKEGPQILDGDRGWRLAAQAIDVFSRSGDIEARHNVRNTMRSERTEGQRGFLSGPDAVATCRSFAYDGRSKTAHYREDALLRSGKDEVRAAEIRVQELDGGKRRLEAQGTVSSLLHPANADASRKSAAAKKSAATPEREAAPVEAHAQTMQYDETAAQVVYRGEVLIRQGDIETKSPEATLTLTPDGSGLETLVAGEPVDVKQGTRTAFGSRGTYTPDDEVMVLVGDKVTLKDPTQEVQGRSLTFHVGDDRIMVDGREEVRTEAVFKKESPKP
jgi:lipopolysaccharide transport protein LptA